MPSHVLRDGSSIDVQVANLALSYENYVRERAEKEGGGVNHSHGKSKEELQAMINRVKKRNEHKVKT